MHVLIIGNGVAGITAARTIRKRSDHRITVISAETDHFFSRTALMYIYMGHMTYEQTKPYEDWFWSKNRIDLVRDWVDGIEVEHNRLRMRSSSPMEYDVLLVATGSRSALFGWPGQDLRGVQGLYAYPDLELLEENTRSARRAVIVGGGLIGMEMAEMLHSRGIQVTMLVREDVPWGNILPIDDGLLVQRHLEDHGITIQVRTELREIIDDGTGQARAVVTSNGETIDCDFVALTCGVTPNIGVVQGTSIEVNRGILVDEYLRTSAPNIYAAGDCAEFRVARPHHPRIEQLWYTARMQGEAVGATISGTPTEYDRGTWFNSAKFFDIEYQTYGYVPAEKRDGEEMFFWKSSDGRRALRLVWNASDRALLGLNVFGIRMRQNVCQGWIRDRVPVDSVMKELERANFDPEFFRRRETEIRAAFVGV